MEDRRGFRLGNPLESEQAAFRWVVAVILAAVVVIALGKLVSSAAGFVAAILLGAFVAVVAARGSWRMLRGEGDAGGPEEAENDSPQPPG